MSEFDPYKSWLDIENKTASTTYYKLLGLPEFESDKDRITAAADKAIRKIRSNKPGEHLAEWQKILDELQEIKALLLDDRKKDAYDDDLRFADEFVRELEGGIKRDPAAAAVAKSAAPKKAESRPVKHDPKYPPGMTPKAPAPPPPPKPTMDDIELKVSPGPKPIDRKDSPFYPPMRSVDKAKPPAPEATPGPQPGLPLESAQAEQDSALRDLMPPGTYPPPPLTTPAASAPVAAETSPSYPPQPAAQPTPYQPQPTAPQQSPYAPAPAPMAQPGAFPPNPYAPQPAAYPQSYYPQAGHPPMAGYPMHAQPAYGQPHPMQTMPQPGYGYGAPMAQPMGYGAPGMKPGYGGMQPMGAPMYGAPMYGAPMAMPMQPQAYMPPPAPAALDPMAPVAIPGMAVTGAPAAAPMVMPYGGAQIPSSVMMPANPAAAIPVGTAMSSSAAAPPDAPAPATLADEPAKGIRSSSATSVMLAAKREKSSQQTLMFVGIGGLLLVVVAVVGFIAASGQFGGTPVATVPPDKGNIPGANDPGKAPAVTVPPNSIRPAIPPVTPEPAKPEPAKPKPPETKPEIKPEPPKPEVPKPEPPKPEPPKPEPVKPEPPKPEPPKPEPPKPVPMPVPPGEMPTKAEVIELAKALKDAKAAIGEFNFLESGADLAKADKLAKLPEHREKLARLKEVEGYVKQFHERLVQSATEMFERGAESFKVGSSTIVGMVEADTKRVILRVAGQNKTYQYSDMPVGLAAALADMKLEGSDPVSRVVKGAYVACHRSSSPDQLKTAKTWWEEATLGGADVSHLMPFLTDSYDLTKDLEKLPKSDAAQPAEAKGTKPAAKGAPDIKALLEGKTP